MSGNGNSRDGGRAAAVGSGRYGRLTARLLREPPKGSRRWDWIWLTASVPALLYSGYQAFTEHAEPLAIRFYLPLILLGATLSLLGNLLYRRWPSAAGLPRLTGTLMVLVALGVFAIGQWQTWDRGWLWWNAAVLMTAAFGVLVWYLSKGSGPTDGS